MVFLGRYRNASSALLLHCRRIKAELSVFYEEIDQILKIELMKSILDMKSNQYNIPAIKYDESND